MMRDPWVRAAIEAGAERIHERLDIKPERVLREAARLASLDVGRMFDDSTGELLPVASMPEDVRRCVAGFDVETHTDKDTGETVTRYRVKLWDKNKALELLAKYHRLITDRVEVNVTHSLADLIVDAGRAVLVTQHGDTGAGNGLGMEGVTRQLDVPALPSLPVSGPDLGLAPAALLESVVGPPAARGEGTGAMGGPGFEGSGVEMVRGQDDLPTPSTKITKQSPEKNSQIPPTESEDPNDVDDIPFE